MSETSQPRPCIEQLRVRNYRALKDITLKKMESLTVLLGPNGSGKSTVFDVFAFLAECFSDGDRRGRFRELRSRGQDGPIVIEIKYRESPDASLITYHLEIQEEKNAPVVEREFLSWNVKPQGQSRPFHMMSYKRGKGKVSVGDKPKREKRVVQDLSGPDVLAVNALGMLAQNPRIIALRSFVTGWYLSYLSANATRGNPEAGGAERLSSTGNNLPNVIQHLRDNHPDRLEAIFETLRRRIPLIEKVGAEVLQDSRLLLWVKDAPFTKPVLARFVSDGTLKMLAYLTVLYDPEPPQLIGIEEPENYLHPRLLPELAEEFEKATERTQLIVTTHSPLFMDRLKPKQVWVLSRARDGYTRVKRVSEMSGIKSFMKPRAVLGDLWMGNYFNDNPLAQPGEDA